uniref:Myotubularin related protein 6 n=1 Tax=Latimeria chalumnae TaxID=7897 RepID=H3B7V1_LATCH
FVFFFSLQVEQVKLLDRFSSNTTKSSGTLYLTATHLIFIDSSPGSQNEIWILHHHIAVVEKLALTATGCPLVIHCKNFRVVHFVIPKERDCHDIYNSLLQLSRPVTHTELYAFSYNPKKNERERELGWKLVDLTEEYKHMGVPNENWQLSDVNRGYKICDTYPSDLYVPRTATKPIIVGSSKFRSKGRFPVLSYYHKEKQAAICRCSQPLSGFSARCLEDEHMLQAISKANPNNRYMYVMDTRPKLNAMANRAAGKGYENEDHYYNIRFQFVGIENIHVMRASLQKLMEVIGTKALSVNDYFSGLESSGWLRHIKAVLDAGIFLTKAVACEGASVLVHCSDGWDRTAQVCSIGSLLLDPYYRTMKGFMVLIEKDWISFGHKFSDRCGQVDGDPKEISPVFTQFLDCVWQLTEQFPRAFEFNEGFLIHVHDHIHSCQFGNFLGNCQKQRELLNLPPPLYLYCPFLLTTLQKLKTKTKPSGACSLFCSAYLSFEQTHWITNCTSHHLLKCLHECCSYNHLHLNTNPSYGQEILTRSIFKKLKKFRGEPLDLSHNSPKQVLYQRSSSPVLKAPNCKGEHILLPVSDNIRTVEGSTNGDGFHEYPAAFVKVEPTVVSLELGVARMTC